MSRLDEIIFDSPNKITFNLFSKAYSYSLYVVIFDLLLQTIYMSITNSELPENILPYYTGFIL